MLRLFLRLALNRRLQDLLGTAGHLRALAGPGWRVGAVHQAPATLCELGRGQLRQLLLLPRLPRRLQAGLALLLRAWTAKGSGLATSWSDAFILSFIVLIYEN